MFAAQGRSLGVVEFSRGIPCILDALSGTPQQLADAVAPFNVNDVYGLSAILGPEQIALLSKLQSGRFVPAEQRETRRALQRLQLAGMTADYHMKGQPGKVSTAWTKSMAGLQDLKLAYSPGVAFASRWIHHDRKLAASFTNRQNTVYVVSDGTAVLGEGPIGPDAFHPVGEGKAILMKLFTGLDAVSCPIALEGLDRHLLGHDTPAEMESYVREFIKFVRALRPATGAINLEDIWGKTCFKILAGLQGMGSLAWHDDQLGTSLVTAAAVITSLKIQGKFSKEAISQLRIVIAGAGAAGIACGRTLRSAFRRLCPEFRDDQIIMTDSKGVLRTSRTDLSDEKREFAVNTDKRSVSDVIHGADVFIGVTTAGTLKLSEDDIRAMNPKPIIFCLANPDPEALPELIDSVRDDAICGTGRSDVKNQANNAGAFPGVLAGGLDVGAETLNLDMIVDAAFALAEIPFQSVPHDLQSLYGYELIPGHRDYATASAFDPRAHFAVARAVARRAHLSGLATFDFSAREAMYGPWFLENRLPHGLLKGSAALLGF